MTKEQYLAKRGSLMNSAKAALDSGNIEEFNKVKSQVTNLDTEFEAAAAAQANYEALQNSAPKIPSISSLDGQHESSHAATDVFDTEEYRNAFMNFACHNATMPERFRNTVATTTTGDVGAVIPTTTLHEIVTELKSRGTIFNSVRKMNVQGGVQIPILDLKPTAHWITEAATSDDQKTSAKQTVSFSYYGLECKIAQTLLTSVTTFAEFQSLFVPLAVEAIITALEVGVFNGTGSGQMLGIVKDSSVKNVVTMSPDDFASWAGWKKNVFAKIKLSYNTGSFYMAKGTFDGYIDGMVDKNGQPIGRVNYGIDSDGTQRFGGKSVVLVEDDIIPPYDTAVDGTVVAVFVDLKNYAINSNMQMTTVHWTDHDNNTIKDKVIIVCDGKLIDPNGVVLIKKGAAASKA
ncbi:MAG: phage major capsid protein [Ruminococcaceae bacterium]|jgi:HK97 family phage major capsid protein|nr:phage major capsid protein [Oscillospiraceae bacterium]